MVKALIARLLRHWAKKRLRVGGSRLIVIAVSGSAGKTSTKEAIALALQPYFPVLSSPKNYNNEFGVPLTILEEETPARASGWLGVLLRARRKSKLPLPYQAAVLEYGVDQPGDMRYLLNIARPDIAVLTNIGTVHLQAFPNHEALKKEKLELAKNRRDGGTAIINADDPALAAAKHLLPGHVIGFGKSSRADVRFQVVDTTPANLVFQIDTPSENPVVVHTQLLSQHQGYILSAALAVVHALGLELGPAVAALQKIQAPPGREVLLVGCKNTTIIDSTYNSSPAACHAMLATLDDVAKHRNLRPVPVLGDMLELGADELPAHCLVVERAATYPLTVLVGSAFRHALDEKFPDGVPAHIHWFSRSEEVPNFLRETLRGNECLLFKASQGIRLEKALCHLLAHLEDADRLLVRQSESWQRR